jgi:hypothetical protein
MKRRSTSTILQCAIFQKDDTTHRENLKSERRRNKDRNRAKFTTLLEDRNVRIHTSLTDKRMRFLKLKIRMKKYVFYRRRILMQELVS